MWEEKYDENHFKVGSVKTHAIVRNNYGAPCDCEEAAAQHKEMEMRTRSSCSDR
jgi:hypothetical protein